MVNVESAGTSTAGLCTPSRLQDSRDNVGVGYRGRIFYLSAVPDKTAAGH